MNKVQIIELLKLRGIFKLALGQSVGEAIKVSGGNATQKELVIVNQNAMKFYIDKFTICEQTLKIAEKENFDLKIQVQKLESIIDQFESYDEN